MIAVKGPDGTPVKLTAEIGHSGLKASGGRIYVEFDPDLRGVQAYRIYDEMRRNDPVVGGSLRAIKMVLGQVRWTVEPGGDTDADREAAGFLESCMEDMSQTFGQLIEDALLCLDFGWAYVETTYKVRSGAGGDPPSRYDDGRVGWRKMTLLGHDTLYQWGLDPHGGIHGMWQSGALTDGTFQAPVLIPIEKAMLFRLNRERNNPEGLSLLRSAYWPWYKKRNIEEIEAIGIERDLTGVLIIYLPEGATSTDYDKALSLIEQFKADDMSGFVAPQFGPEKHQQWRFEIINSPGSKSIDTDKVVTRYAREIARNFLTQFLMLGETQTGSWALSRTHFDMFETALLSILQSITDVINRYAVPALFRLNDFGQLTALPRFAHGRIGRVALKAFAESLVPLVQAQLLTPEPELEQYIRTELDLPALPEGAERKPAEETGPREEREFAEDDDLDNPDPYGDDDEQDIDRLLEEIERKTSENRLGQRLFAKRSSSKINLDKAKTELFERFQRRMGGHAVDFRAGKITQQQWAARGKAEIQEHVRAAHKVGLAEARGVYPPSKIRLTEAERRQANTMVDRQLKYFKGFRDDVQRQLAEGKPLTGALEARARLYAGAVKEAANDAKLSEKPATKLRWNRHKEDSCETCLRLENRIETAEQWKRLDVWPAHNTICHGNCGCSLDPA